MSAAFPSGSRGDLPVVPLESYVWELNMRVLGSNITGWAERTRCTHEKGFLRPLEPRRPLGTPETPGGPRDPLGTPWRQLGSPGVPPRTPWGPQDHLGPLYYVRSENSAHPEGANIPAMVYVCVYIYMYVYITTQDSLTEARFAWRYAYAVKVPPTRV